MSTAHKGTGGTGGTLVLEVPGVLEVLGIPERGTTFRPYQLIQPVKWNRYSEAYLISTYLESTMEPFCENSQRILAIFAKKVHRLGSKYASEHLLSLV